MQKLTANLLETKYIARVLFLISISYFTYLLLKDSIGNSYWENFLVVHFDFIWRDKLIHVFIFTVLSFLLNLSFDDVKKNVSFLLFYGLLIEVLQGTITETRTFDLFDFVADAVGIAFGWKFSTLKIVHKILKLKN